MNTNLNRVLITLMLFFSGSTFAVTTILDFNDVQENPKNNWASVPNTTIIYRAQSPYTTTTSIGGSGNTAIVAPLINGFNSGDHLHTGASEEGGASDIEFYTHTDTGGIYFNVVDQPTEEHTLQAFAFKSLDIISHDFDDSVLTETSPSYTSYTIKGYKGGLNGMESGGQKTEGAFSYVGGQEVASVVLTKDTPLGVFDFLAADSGFGDVDHVEMYFTDYYRTTTVAVVLDFRFDDVAISDPITAVPVPAAVWLFGTGLIGLTSLRKRKVTAIS